MRLLRSEIYERFNKWLDAWNEHDLEGVMEFIHEDVIFNSWNGSSVCGKAILKKSCSDGSIIMEILNSLWKIFLLMR